MPSRRAITTVAVLVFLSWTVLGNFAATLRQMHVPGGVSASVADVASPFTSSGEAKEIVRSWRAWDDYLRDSRREEGPKEVKADRREVSAPPRAIVVGWLLVDSLAFAPLLALLLYLCARRRQRFKPTDEQQEGGWGRWLGSAAVFAALYLLADEAENAFTGAFILGATSIFGVVRLLGALKLLFLVLAAVPIVLSLALPARDAKAVGVAPLRPMVQRLRMPLVIIGALAAVFIFLPGDVRGQLDDVVRTWAPGDDPSALLWAIGMLGALTLTIWAAGSLALARNREVTSRRFSRWVLVVHLAGSVAVLGATLLVHTLTDLDLFAPAGYVLGGGWLLSTVLWKFTGRPENKRKSERADAGRLLAVCTGAPALLFAALVLRAMDLSGPAGPKWIALGVAAGAIATGLLLAYNTRPIGTPESAWLLVGVLGTCALALSVTVVQDPIERGWAIGSAALLLLALTSMLIVLTLGEQIFWNPPSGIFQRLRLERAPIVAIIVGTVLLTGRLDSKVGFHAIREQGPAVREEGLRIRRDINLEDAIDTYKGNQPPPAAPAASDGPEEQQPIVPLFFLAASGGGARAAYWTLLTLNCLFGGTAPAGIGDELTACDDEPAAWDHVFMTSGISGGSVGLAMYAAQQGSPGADAVTVPVDEVFADGFLDPVMAGMLFFDLPNSLVMNDTWTDRAGWLEQEWELRIREMEQGLFESQLADGAPRLPVLLLNSAAIEDGCRINVSVLDLVDEKPPEKQDGSEKPSAVHTTCRSLDRFERRTTANSNEEKARPLAATRDVNDYVCGDIALSTAALLSARFPFVSPTGGLTACDDSHVPKGQHTFAGDGGYVDSSGASTVAELIDAAVDRAEAQPELANACVQPVALMVDNGYSDLTKPKGIDTPDELLAPLIGQQAASGSRADAARQALAIEASRLRCGKTTDDRATYFHVYPRARPGIEAPLGWSLSEAARNDLESQLAIPANAAALCAAKQWLVASDLECPKVPDPLAPFAEEARLPGGALLLPVAALVVVLGAWWWIWRWRVRWIRTRRLFVLTVTRRDSGSPPPFCTSR